MSFYGVPWSWVRRAYRLYMTLRPTVAKPDDDPHLVTEASIEDLRVALGKQHYTNSWEISYAYEGEDLNMRRPEYDEGAMRPWKQTHVRGFSQPEGVTELFAHYELEPSEYPELHYREVGYDVERGLSVLAGCLDTAGIEYELIA